VFLTVVPFFSHGGRMNTKFCFKLGKTPIKTYEILHIICGDEALSCSYGFEWFKHF
jgi:hypothetical protein